MAECYGKSINIRKTMHKLSFFMEYLLKGSIKPKNKFRSLNSEICEQTLCVNGPILIACWCIMKISIQLIKLKLYIAKLIDRKRLPK